MSTENVCGLCHEEFPSSLQLYEHRCPERVRIEKTPATIKELSDQLVCVLCPVELSEGTHKAAVEEGRKRIRDYMSQLFTAALMVSSNPISTEAIKKLWKDLTGEDLK